MIVPKSIAAATYQRMAWTVLSVAWLLLGSAKIHYFVSDSSSAIGQVLVGAAEVSVGALLLCRQSRVLGVLLSTGLLVGLAVGLLVIRESSCRCLGHVSVTRWERAGIVLALSLLTAGVFSADQTLSQRLAAFVRNRSVKIAIALLVAFGVTTSVILSG